MRGKVICSLNVVEGNDFVPGVTQSLKLLILAVLTRMSLGLDWCLVFGVECLVLEGVCRTCRVILLS